MCKMFPSKSMRSDPQYATFVKRFNGTLGPIDPGIRILHSSLPCLPCDIDQYDFEIDYILK